jgi:hypothetical protein
MGLEKVQNPGCHFRNAARMDCRLSNARTLDIGAAGPGNGSWEAPQKSAEPAKLKKSRI